jgi:hypothetical protein
VPVPYPEWRFPVRLVTSGVIRDLWKSKDLERGNASAASLLPVLALHVSPKSPSDDWTGVHRLSYLEFAGLSGIGHGSVGPAVKRLHSAKLLQRQIRARVGGKLVHFSAKWGKRMVFYRLNAKALYPQENEGYVALQATFFLSKTWADLPPAGRPLYLVLRGLEEYPVTLSELAELSGLPRRTLLRTLNVLRGTVVDGRPLVPGLRANGPNLESGR